jgi:hypothetical protein
MNTLQTITSERSNKSFKGGTTMNGTGNISLKEARGLICKGTWLKKFRDPEFIKDLMADLLIATFVLSLVLLIGMHFVHIFLWA